MRDSIQTFSDYHIRSYSGISITPHLEDYPIFHNHTFYEIQIHVRGSILHEYGNNVEETSKEILESGDILLIAPHLSHCLKKIPDSPQMYYLNLAISENLFASITAFFNISEINNLLNLSKPFLKIHLSKNELKKVLASYNNLASMNQYTPEYLISLKFLFISLLENFHKTSFNNQQDPLPSWLVEFINTINTPEAFQLHIKDLAQYSFYSYNYLCALFKKHMGVTLQTYFTTLKMNYAALLLRTTSLKVVDITNRIGYTNQGHFSVHFKTLFKMSPLEYRKKFTSQN